MTRTAHCKSWLLCQIDGIATLTEIQRNDRLMLLATDADAVRRARCEAHRGRADAQRAVALHQRAKPRCRLYRVRSTQANGGVQ